MSFSKTASDLAFGAKKTFLRENANLIACLDVSAEDLFKKISAELALDDSAEEAVEFYAEGIDQKNQFARDTARADFASSMNQQFCLSFLKLRTRGAIQFSIELTPEAESELYELEVASGCRRSKQAIADEASAQTAAESLDETIKKDWNSLPTSAIQAKKKANPAYAQRLEQMLNEGII